MRRRIVVNADALWECLRRQHLSHGKFAKKVGISAGYLSQLIGGDRSPSPAVTRRMLEVLNVEFDRIFRFSPDAPIEA